MRCQEVKTILYTYLDDNLDRQIERAFFGHLSQCKSCQKELDDARQTHALLEKYCTLVEPPVDFVDSVMLALDGNLAAEELSKDQKQDIVVAKKTKKSQKRFLGNFKLLAQVASFVLLSATVWFATQFSGAFQLARIPEPGDTPGTGYEVAKDANEQQSSPDFQIPVKPEKQLSSDDSQPKDIGGNDSEVIEAEPQESEKSNGPEVLPEEEKQPPSAAEAITEPPKAKTDFQMTPDPMPVPNIVEPTGPMKAAGVGDNKALTSISLQRVASGETRYSNGIFYGNQIKYLAGAIGNQLEVWASGSSGENPGRLGKTAKKVDDKAIWSHDGKELAYINKENNRGTLYLDDLSGSIVEIMPPAEIGEIKYPSWSKKGEIAYLFVGASGNQIVVSKGQDSTVIGTTDIDCAPVWSPDGGRLAYGKQGQIYVVSRDGTQEKEITKLGGQIQGIAWSPDGNTLAASVKGSANQQGLWVGSIENKDWKQMAELGGGRELIWSPDGQKIAFTDARKMAYLLTFTATGKKDKLYSVTPEGVSGGVDSLAWSTDSKGLLLAWASPGETQGIWKGVLP